MNNLSKNDIIGILIVAIIVLLGIIYTFYKANSVNDYYPCTYDYTKEFGDQDCNQYREDIDEAETEYINDLPYQQSH